ncbi:MAG: hypothetical protein FD155_2096 [Bacteroidetes bacterium]|nr:MAG: hypothetical protein FD155_2096 [Bacteroidota bacterium]
MIFNLFKKKSATDKLQEKYEKLMAESHHLSKTNRIESDKKYAEAQDILRQMDAADTK